MGDDYLDILYTTFPLEPADNTTIHTEKSLLYLKLKYKLFQLIVYASSCFYAHLAVVTAPFCHTGAACFSHSGGYELRNCCCGQAPMQDASPSVAATEALTVAPLCTQQKEKVLLSIASFMLVCWWISVL